MTGFYTVKCDTRKQLLDLRQAFLTTGSRYCEFQPHEPGTHKLEAVLTADQVAHAQRSGAQVYRY